MTREEAIKQLKGMVVGAEWLSEYMVEALEMAIEALEQEPTPNDDYFRKIVEVAISQLRADRDRLEDELAKREQEPSGDLIRRQAVLDGLKGCICEEWIKTLFATMVKQLPSVNPKEPKAGHWIKSNIPNEEYVCSECGGACWYYDYQGDVAKSKFCPNCGAKMVEPQESEDEK